MSPNPVVTIVIETAVKSARTMSAAHATDVDGIAASTRTPTPALPPVPWTSPIPNAPSGRADRMVMVLVLVGVRVQVEVAVPPADEEPERQEHDQRGDGRLGALLHPLGQELLEEEDRQPEQHERERVAEAPERAEPGCCPAGALLPRGNERGHCRDVVGIRGMTEAEERGDEDHDEDGAPGREIGDRVVETEHGGNSPSFPDRFRSRPAGL